MIEIKFPKKDEESGRMYIEGKLVDPSQIEVLKGSLETTFLLGVKNVELSKKLLSYKPSDFSHYIEYSSFSYKTDEWYLLSNISIIHKTRKIKDESGMSGYKVVPVKNKFKLFLTCEPNLSEWNKEYTFNQYVTEFLRIASNVESKKIKFSTYINDVSYVRNPAFVTNLEVSIFDCVFKESFENTINEWIPVLVEIHRETENDLLSSKQANSIILTFDFPDEVKAPCEQYLIYFSQFLRDLGVKATSDLNHEAGQVLFTVTPDNPEQALDKIRTALEVYLQLPASPIDAYPDVSTEIELQRHIANIQHLKGQLSLAKAEIRAAESAIELKDTTIQVLRLTLDEQNRLLSGDISSSIKDVTPRPKDKDKEDLIEGIVSLKPYDAKVADVNLPEIWRRLKKLFKDES